MCVLFFCFLSRQRSVKTLRWARGGCRGCSLLTPKEKKSAAVPARHESPSGAFKSQTGLRSKCCAFSTARSQRFRRAGATKKGLRDSSPRGASAAAAVSRHDSSRENSVWSAPQSATNAKFKIFFPLKMARAKRKPFKIVSALQTAHLYPLLQKIAFSANLCLTTDRLSDIIEHGPAVRCRTNLSDHGPVAQLVRAPACHAGGRRFEPDPGRHLLL